MASCERLRTCGYTSSVRHPVQMIWLCGAPPAHTHRAQRVSRNALRARGRFTPHAGRATCTHAPPDDDAAVLLPCRATHTQPRAHRHQPLGDPANATTRSVRVCCHRHAYVWAASAPPSSGRCWWRHWRVCTVLQGSVVQTLVWWRCCELPGAGENASRQCTGGDGGQSTAAEPTHACSPAVSQPGCCHSSSAPRSLHRRASSPLLAGPSEVCICTLPLRTAALLDVLRDAAGRE